MSFLNCVVRLYLAQGRTVVEMALKALQRGNALALNPNYELGQALAAFRTSPSASSPPSPLFHGRGSEGYDTLPLNPHLNFRMEIFSEWRFKSKRSPAE